MQQITDPSQAARILSPSNPLAAFNSVFGNLVRPPVIGLTHPVQTNNALLQKLLNSNNPYKQNLGLSGLGNNINPLLMNKLAIELQQQSATLAQQTKTAQETIKSVKNAFSHLASSNAANSDSSASSLSSTTNNAHTSTKKTHSETDNKTSDESLFFQVHLPGMNTLTAIGGIHPQITRPARRLYVGNLPVGMGLNEQILCEFFSQCCKGLGIGTPNPVLSVWLNSEQTFGFIEFRSVQDTNLALQLFEGLQLGGRQLRFGRPVDYKEPPENLKNYVVGGEHETNCDPAKHIEQGSPAAMLLMQQQQQQQQQHLLKSVVNGGGTQDASKKTLDLAILAKQRAMLEAMIANGQSNKNVNNAAGEGENEEDVEMDAKEKAEEEEKESSVLLLMDMIGEEDIRLDEEYEDIKDDIQCECENFGELLEVVIPKIGEKGCGRVFVRYASAAHAKKCKSKVDGRKFGDRTVKCIYFDETRFAEKQYDDKVD